MVQLFLILTFFYKFVYNIAVLKSRKNLRKKKSWALKFAENHKTPNINKLNRVYYRTSRTYLSFFAKIFEFKICKIK